MFVDFCFVPCASKTHGLYSLEIAGHVSEPQDIVSDVSFAEKQSFLRRGQLASGDLPAVRTDKCKISIMTVQIMNIKS